jgi:hypothetical protein
MFATLGDESSQGKTKGKRLPPCEYEADEASERNATPTNALLSAFIMITSTITKWHHVNWAMLFKSFATALKRSC